MSCIKLGRRQSDGLGVSDTEQHRPHLRVLDGREQSGTAPLEVDVRNARRDLARLLRAMQATGHSVTRWETDAVTRLAHFDSVTARFLLDCRGEPDGVQMALRGLRSIERWLEDSLTAEERAVVRTFEIVIRIEDAALHQPLLRPDHAPEEQSPEIEGQPPLALRSLRAGLRGLSDEALDALSVRLGIPPYGEDEQDDEWLAKSREHLTESIVSMLRDDHLLAILLATLDGQVQQVLFELVCGGLTPSDFERLAEPVPLQLVVGGAPLLQRNPLETLRSCGLLFGQGVDVWVPVELQPRIDGTLRGFGL